MFDRSTDACRRVFGLARSAALHAGHDHIGAGHILHAFLDPTVKDAVGPRAARACGVDPEQLRNEIERRMPPAPGRTITGQVPWTWHAKSVLEHALEEANAAGVSYVTTEHLLLGLLRLEDGLVPELLADLRADLDGVRLRIAQVLAEGAGHEELASARVRPPGRLEEMERRLAALEARIRKLEERGD